MSVSRYVETLSLADDLPVRLQSRNDQVSESRGMRSGNGSRDTSAPGGIPEDLKAAVDVGSLLSFVDGIDVTERQDVLYSVQLAQRGASGLHDRFTATEQWYKKYVEILETLGWAAEQMAFSRFDESSGNLRMDKAAIGIISAIATQNQLMVLKEALKALESLADDEGSIELFDFNTSRESSGNFQLGAVQKSENGALSLAIGAFHFQSNDARRRFLFFAWGAQNVNFWTSAQKMTLNTDFYQNHRQQVEDKLAATASNYIAELELAI